MPQGAAAIAVYCYREVSMSKAVAVLVVSASEPVLERSRDVG